MTIPIVIPADAGIQNWIPVFTGMTANYHLTFLVFKYAP